MDSFFGWAATALTAYLAGRDFFEHDTSTSDGTGVLSQDALESDVFASSAHARTFEQGTYPELAFPPLPGGFPVAPPPPPPLNRRARHQHGLPKRLRVAVGAYEPVSPSPIGNKKNRHGGSKSSPKDLEARVEVHLPNRALSAPSTPAPHGEISSSTLLTEDTGLDVQAVRRSNLGPTNPLSLAGAASTPEQPWSFATDDVVIGRKRPAPAEFDEEVLMPHRKKYITGWMSEYIKLRASSWRGMLKVMREARWRPFRPQVIHYLSPAPPSAPLTASRYGYINSVTGDLPVMTPVASSIYRAESPSPSLPPPSPDSPSSPFLPTTTTPPYSPPESPLPFTPHPSPCPEVEAVAPPDIPTPPSAVACSLTWSVQDPTDSLPSTPRISWVDKGKWRVDASPERVAYRLDSIVTENPTAATDLPPSLPFPSPPFPPSFPDIPLSSTAPTTSFHPLRFPTLRTDRLRPVSNSKQLRTHQEGLRRLKSTRLEPTKFAYLRLRSQVKWRLQEISRRKRTPSDLPSLPPLPLPSSILPPPTPSTPLVPAPLLVPRKTGTSRTTVPAPKRFERVKLNRRSKTTRPKPFKMGHLRLRSQVRWHLKDLGFGKWPPPPPTVSTQPTQAHPVLVKIGPIAACLWPASVFNSYSDESMEGVEFLGAPP